MGFLKKNRSYAMVLVGTLVMGTSVLWEYARMRPDYRFIVDPWSIRGYETTQGIVVAVIAAAVLALATLLAFKVIKTTLVHSIAVAGAVTVGAVLVAVFSGAREVQPSWPVTWGLAFLAALAALAVVTRLLPEDASGTLRRSASIGTFLGTFLITGLAVFHPAFGGSSTPAWLLVLVSFLLLGVLTVARPPGSLASYRTLINMQVIGWLVSITMAASVRVHLQGLQQATPNGAAELRDIQITSGMLIAWLGGLIAFAGAVAMWAQVRELLATSARSRAQMEAARRSAEELGAPEEVGADA